MDGRDRERFVKLLGLTESSNDGEALAALRKCNAMLRQQHLTWEDIVAGRCADRTLKPRSSSYPASPSRTFEAAIRREQLFEQIRREEKAMAMRIHIRKVPLLLRLLFFPLWATAEMVVATVVPEPSPSWRAVKSFTVVLVLAVSSIIWLQAFDVVVLLLEEAADAAVPWVEQAWQQVGGDQDLPTAGGTGLNGPFSLSR